MYVGIFEIKLVKRGVKKTQTDILYLCKYVYIINMYISR